jgi:phage-related protein
MKNRDEERHGTSTFGATEPKSKTQEAVSSVTDKVRNVASAVGEKARDAASSVAHTAGSIASSIGETADSATAAVGGGIKSLGETMHDKGPHSGVLGSANATVADTLESGGRYLQEHGLGDIGADLTNMVRRNPLPAVLLGIGFGIGVGYLIARATSSRS